MNRMKKGISLIMALIFTLSVFSVMGINTLAAQSGDVIGGCDYIINNPYKSVNWDTWKAYRGATHVHTVRSDGNVEVDDMIEDYYAHGYQCLALTDHGTVNYSWHEKQTRLAIFDYQWFVHGTVDPLSDERYAQITTGADRGGDGMIEIPLGIELNGASTSKCHVNSYFADCGHGDLEMSATWPEDAVKKSQNAGGICHINHVGEWTDGKDDIGTYDSAFIEKFSKLFLNYSSCIGMELVNTKDNRTHNDRYLYDETLKITAPQGRNIFGFCEDDSHDPEDVGNNAQFFLMPQNTAANVRTCMETGAFFACSKNAKTSDELGNGFNAQGDFPMVDRVEVDDETNTISFTVRDGSVIKMVADGRVIAQTSITANHQKVSFDLNSYESSIGSYVRFYITGAGGICYAQPFLLKKQAIQKSIFKFNVKPASATVTVKDASGNVVAPANANKEYVLDKGTYTYTVASTDYDVYTGDINVTDKIANRTIDVTLNRQLVYSIDKNSYTVDYQEALLYGVKLPESEDIIAAMRPVSGVTLSVTPTAKGYGTGSIITARDTDGTTKTIKFVYFGDVNGDGWYDGTDSIIVKCLAKGMLKPENVDNAILKAADCNHDGVIDDDDCTLLNKAGILLAGVDQTNGFDSLATSSVLTEYLSLIDQSPVVQEETQEIQQTEKVEPVVDEGFERDSIFDMFLSFLNEFMNFFKSIFSVIAG